jgi:hypothetical protein
MPKIRPIGILSIIIIAALALTSACSLPDGRKPADATYTSVIDSLSAKNPLSDGVHIIHTDSVYTVKANEDFGVSYEICVVNVQGFYEAFSNVFPDQVRYPEWADKIREDWGAQSTTTTFVNGKTSKSASAQYIITLRVEKSGTYQLPARTFTYNDKKYPAPAIKVIVR